MVLLLIIIVFFLNLFLTTRGHGTPVVYPAQLPFFKLGVEKGVGRGSPRDA